MKSSKRTDLGLQIDELNVTHGVIFDSLIDLLIVCDSDLEVGHRILDWHGPVVWRPAGLLHHVLPDHLGVSANRLDENDIQLLRHSLEQRKGTMS